MNILFQTASTVSDEELRRQVQQLRRRLGYWELGDRDFELPHWLRRWLEGSDNSYNGWSRFGQWLFQEQGWVWGVVLIFLITAILLFLIFRKSAMKRKLHLADSGKPGESPPAEVFQRNREEWFSEMKGFLEKGNYNLALVALYRTALTTLMDRQGMLDPLSNREICRLIEGAEKNCFAQLSRQADAYIFGNYSVEEQTFHQLYQHYTEVFCED